MRPKELTQIEKPKQQIEDCLNKNCSDRDVQCGM
jgi:hypothetical protein